MPKINHLWVIMPVFNEVESIESVVREWHNEFKKQQLKFTFCILNDGSTDSTLEVLTGLEKLFPELLIVDKLNSGHGQTCIHGYKLAIENKSDYVFQIDSDGQCDPIYFGSFLESNYSNIFGYRKSRDDGFKRNIVSKFVSIFTFLATKIWVKDANVPYRLILTSDLVKIINFVPSDFHLANILISVLLKKYSSIDWIPIHFNERRGGIASVKTFSFVKHGMKLFHQLRKSLN